MIRNEIMETQGKRQALALVAAIGSGRGGSNKLDAINQVPTTLTIPGDTWEEDGKGLALVLLDDTGSGKRGSY